MLAKPNVIINDVRLRGLAVAGREAAGRKSPHNQIQFEGLDSKSAADVAASLADALEELHRLQRILDRRIRRDQ